MIYFQLLFYVIYLSKLSEAAVTLAEKADILNLHNSIRRTHSNGNLLKWNTHLAKKSEHFVKFCKRSNRKHTMELYKDVSAVGNIANGYSSWNETIEAWYASKSYYDFDHPGYTKKSSPFISMAWKSSSAVGCSSFNCTGNNIYHCLYSPSIPPESLFDEKTYKVNILYE